MDHNILLTGSAIAAAVIAVGIGPLRFMIRAILRALVGHDAMRRWQTPATIGVGAGLVLTPLVCGMLIDSDAAMVATVVGLLALLALLDLAWRWLPFAWTLPLILLGLLSAFLHQTVPEAILGAAIGSGTLWLLQFLFRVWRGVVALGMGDIWLAAGLGTLVGPALISWVLGFAAASALAVEGTRWMVFGPAKRQRLGVAYGTHMCGAYLVICFLIGPYVANL